MISKIQLPFLILSIVVLSGCANPYRSNFNSTRAMIPVWIENRFSPPVKKPTLRKSNDIRADNWKLFEQGYFMVGYSKFDGKSINESLALKKAKSIGADIVLLENTFTKTMTETVSYTQWSPVTTTEIRDDTTYSDRRGDRDVSRRTEIRSGGDPQTVLVPRQVAYYEHSATFWKKVDTFVFGASVAGLSDEAKKKLQTNKGLVVLALVIDSPAYNADLLKDDIILKINGEAVPGMKQFYSDINAMAGKVVELTLLRGTQTVTKKFKLNP